jgi:hypothetical protein
MAKQAHDKRPVRAAADAAPTAGGDCELIVVMTPDMHSGDAAPSLDSATHPLAALLPGLNTRLQPLFAPVRASAASAATDRMTKPASDVPHPSLFVRVQAPDVAAADLAQRLREHDAVDAAFVKPAFSLPLLNDMPPAAAEPPSRTPDFISDQGYLDAAPAGVDARFAWSAPGGGGAGVKIIDVEGAWCLTHEDLAQNLGGMVGGSPQPNIAWRNHGTAVMGVIGADRNGFGVTGVAPEASIRTLAAFRSENSRLVSNSAAAIAAAAALLDPGDILLVELHRPGPRYGFAASANESGYIPIEWWPDDYAAIAATTARGIIVVAAGGNGGEFLDDPLYDLSPGPPFGPFPSWWKNPFRRSPLDSGAVLVGAGAPPPGTHGRELYGPDRSRLDFSNYGTAIDTQGWGREVTTAGYGDKQGGLNENAWYTDQFSGTSSASPIVVGALACLGGLLRGANAPVLTPTTARRALRSTGSPQTAGPGRPVNERIGSRPDLRALAAHFGVTNAPPEAVESQHDGPKRNEPGVVRPARTKTIRVTRESKEVREIVITHFRD